MNREEHHSDIPQFEFCHVTVAVQHDFRVSQYNAHHTYG